MQPFIIPSALLPLDSCGISLLWRPFLLTRSNFLGGHRTGGDMKAAPNRLRIADVTDGRLTFSPWTDSSTLTMQIKR